MTAFYNEIDPYAAAWLRNLIAAGHIAPGVVDERSIEDINPEELNAYTQCHFFAGIGVWSLALRRAGWPDDQPVWTGSCPCQPFSAAGKGGGFDDERHLWPAFHHLIRSHQPAVVFGEQVASRDGRTWLGLVHADLEGLGYSFGAADLCAAGVGAPHIRQRLYWVAESAQQQQHGPWRGGAPRRDEHPNCGSAGLLAHHHHQGLEGGQRPRERAGIQRQAVERGGEVGDMSDAQAAGCGQRIPHASGCDERGRAQGAEQRTGDSGVLTAGGGRAVVDAQGEQMGLPRCSWESGIADWIPCRDGKWRPVEPGTFPLAHGAPSRVGRLRAYGNAIVAPCAEAFIRAYLGSIQLRGMFS